MPRKALVTFGLGPHAELLDIARPGFMDYAERHGYDYVEIEQTPNPESRPFSWLKIPVLMDVLQEYDEAQWIDSDVVIVDGSQDLADNVPLSAWQALVFVGNGPPLTWGMMDCAVWYLRKPIIPYLKAAWELTEYIHHPLWEQAAMLDLCGFDLQTYDVAMYRVCPKSFHTDQTKALISKTYPIHPVYCYYDTLNLDPSWSAYIKFRHFGGIPFEERKKLMKLYAHQMKPFRGE